ncbi:MAG TPA: amidase [Deltaproteobacteria bacterium]|nr:amidase [Deltaproteobacteria bacterium]
MWLSLIVACVRAVPPAPVEPPRPLEGRPAPSIHTAWLSEVTVAELRRRLAAGELTSVALVEASLARIEGLDRSGPQLRAVLAVSDAAQAEAAERDAASPIGSLHGLPILLKDNIDAVGLPTTAGSLALARHVPSADAFLTARLREAGAVVLGKANLSEWANFRSTASTSGWSAVGGQTRNPHVLDRSPCGSSSGSAVAVAAGLVPLAVGTETDGSILCPASINGIVGIKPTMGLVSRRGIVPISPSQDTAGPMARTVAGAALLLEVLAAVDPSDPAASARPAQLDTRYTAVLSPDALQGARIGVARGVYDFDPGTTSRFEAAVEDLRRLGAEVIALDLPVPESASEQEWIVLVHEFQPALEAYLATVEAGPSSLEDLIAFDQAHADTELRWFGQDIFETVVARDQAEDPVEARRASQAALGPGWIDALVEAHDLDAIVAPTTGPAWPIDPLLGDRYTGGSASLTAISGYPAITVPMGRVEQLPVGLSFLGPAFTEARLIRLAHAYEQGTSHRVVPGFVASLIE